MFESSTLTSWRVLGRQVKECVVGYGGVTANVLNDQSRTATDRSPPDCGTIRGTETASPLTGGVFEM